MVSIPRVRQRLACGITKLISAGAADFDNLIRTFPCRAEGTFVGIFGSQGNFAHDPVPHFESTGLDSGVVIFGDALFVRDIMHARLVPELVNEVEVEGQLLVIGRGIVSGGSVCGLANLYRSHGLGSK